MNFYRIWLLIIGRRLYEDFLEPLLMLSESNFRGRTGWGIGRKMEGISKGVERPGIFDPELSAQWDLFWSVIFGNRHLRIYFFAWNGSRWSTSGSVRVYFFDGFWMGKKNLLWVFPWCIVVLTRMTGYEEEDILEYLENSFQSPIWEWGYFALLLSSGIEG